MVYAGMQQLEAVVGSSGGLLYLPAVSPCCFPLLFSPAVSACCFPLQFLPVVAHAAPFPSLPLNHPPPGSAMSLAMLTHWVCNVIIGQFFLAAVAKVGVSGVYCAFGVVCILAVLYIQGNVVETKGKTVEEIQKLMG